MYTNQVINNEYRKVVNIVSPELSNSPKYIQLVTTSKDLFVRYGIKRVTIEEICKTSKVSKMTFYKFFRNKDDLVMKIMNDMMDEGQGTFDRIMASDLPFHEKMVQFIKLKTDYANQISMEFYQDFINYSPEVHKYVIERSQKSIGIMMAAFNEAQQKGEIRSDLDLNFLSFLLGKIQDMAEDLSEMFDDTEEFARQFMNFFMYGIIGRKPME